MEENQRFARRHPGARASLSVQNRCSPFAVSIRVCAYNPPPGTWEMRVTFWLMRHAGPVAVHRVVKGHDEERLVFEEFATPRGPVRFASHVTPARP